LLLLGVSGNFLETKKSKNKLSPSCKIINSKNCRQTVGTNIN